MHRLSYVCIFAFLLLAFVSVQRSGLTSLAQTIPDNPLVVYLPVVANIAPTPTTRPTRIPTPTPLSVGLEVKSSTGFISAGSKFYRIDGEVINRTNGNAYGVKIKADFFDATHNLLESDTARAFFGMVSPGHTVAFELLAFKSIDLIASYETTVFFYNSESTDYRTPTVLSQQIRNNAGIEVFGEVRNDSGGTLRGVALALTFYDAAGRVIRAYPGSIDIDLGNGQKAAYSINTSDNFGYASYTVQAQSYIPH